MNPKAEGTLETAVKVQCICTLVHGEVLRQFDLLSADVESANSLTVDFIILGLGRSELQVCRLSLHTCNSADVESANSLTVDFIILGLGSYYFSVNSISKNKRAMCRVMKKTHGLKVRSYAARLVGLNEYLDSVPGGGKAEAIV